MSKRTVLPLTPVNHPGRQSMTCQYRCADACSQEIPNTTSNPTFGEIVTASASRRAVLKGSGLGVAVVGVNAVAGQVQPVAAAESTSTVTAKAPFNFQGVPPQPFGEDRIQVPEGMVYKRVISWGEGLFDDSPKFDFDNQTAAAQEKQFGYNNDFVAVFPRGIANKAVMFVNHEYTNDELMFRGYTGPASLTDEQLKVILEIDPGVESVGIVYSYAPNADAPGETLADEAVDPSQLTADDRAFLDEAIRDYNAQFGTAYDTSAQGFEGYYEDISRRLAERTIDLVIVVNMFLTGFDATTLNTLFVDKNLRAHGLIQAYSRTNRILNSVKTYGNIVSFRDLDENTNGALELFGNADIFYSQTFKPVEAFTDAGEQLAHPADEVDRAAADVVEGHDAADLQRAVGRKPDGV